MTTENLTEKKLPNGPDSYSRQKVKYCGHEAWFLADIYITPFAVTVIASGKMNLSYANADKATWHIVDHNGGYWNKERGVFVLPRESVTRLAP